MRFSALELCSATPIACMVAGLATEGIVDVQIAIQVSSSDPVTMLSQLLCYKNASEWYYTISQPTT